MNRYIRVDDKKKNTARFGLLYVEDISDQYKGSEVDITSGLKF